MKQNLKYRIFFWLALVMLLQWISLPAQQKVQVASKTYSYKFDASISLIRIFAEKSEILLSTSPDNTCRVEVKLLSKNTVQSEAIRDLKAVKFKVDEKEDAINFRNYYDPPAERAISSNLSVKFTISIPADKKIEIQALYSQITSRSVNLNATIDAAFSDIALFRCDGSIALKSYYSAFDVQEGKASLTGSLDKSDMKIRNYSGPIAVTTNYGEILIEQQNSFSEIKFTSTYTKYTVSMNRELMQNLSFTAISGNIEVPSEYAVFVKKEKNKVLMVKNIVGSRNSLSINTTYNTITLHEKQE